MNLRKILNSVQNHCNYRCRCCKVKMTSKEEEVERDMRRTITAFNGYFFNIQKRHESQRNLIIEATSRQKNLLIQSGFLNYLDNLLNCAEANQKVLKEILSKVETPFSRDDPSLTKYDESLDMDRCWINQTLVHIVREWSESGIQERDQSFGLILEHLIKIYPDKSVRKDVQIFVPGSKLARLPFMIAAEGFECFANEDNLSYLFVANFIMNHCNRESFYRIYPWIHDLRNRQSTTEVTTPVSFPDINPSVRPDNFVFQMVPGDFVQVAQNQFHYGSIDCVVSCFFLETGHNVLKYVQEIRRLVKTNGYWINLGSLSYAYEPFDNQVSINLPLETLKKTIEDFGFEFLEENFVDCSYCYSQEAATQCKVNAHFFVCRAL